MSDSGLNADFGIERERARLGRCFPRPRGKPCHAVRKEVLGDGSLMDRPGTKNTPSPW
jgi:hypothetical protein